MGAVRAAGKFAMSIGWTLISDGVGSERFIRLQERKIWPRCSLPPSWDAAVEGTCRGREGTEMAMINGTVAAGKAAKMLTIVSARARVPLVPRVRV